MNHGWAGTIEQFVQLDMNTFINQLQTHIFRGSSATTAEEQRKREEQKRAWEDSFDKLQAIFQRINSLNGSLIFEYEILRGGGRRPDVILLLEGYLIVIECKSYNRVSASEYIQTSLYARDLEHYHSAVHRTNTEVIGTLFLTNYPSNQFIFKDVHQIFVSTPNSLLSLINKCLNEPRHSTLSMEDFLNGVYEPSPSMLEAARAIYNQEPLPKIKAVGSSNFSQVEDTVKSIIKDAQMTNTHHLILVSGEPGAGKTYLGLNIAHDTDIAVYLSGNGPLVDVLQDTLRNRTFVQGLYAYKMNYLEHGSIPHEKVIIFDEAQRAWDANEVDKSLKRKYKAPMYLSEPDVIMQIATTNKPWSVTIGLIGEGQEIYTGEEGGLALWNKAIGEKDITVHARHDHSLFSNAARYEIHEHLHLNCSFRAHAALQYYAVVNSLLDGRFEHAAEIIRTLPKNRYSLFVTRDLNIAKTIAHELYEDDTKTTGFICASGADDQKEIPVLPRNERNERPSKIAQYFNYPPSKYFCKKLHYSATEFQTQGLELDTAIIQWDDDLYLKHGQWKGQHFQRNVNDKFQIKLNSYRVILTRGRDGTIIYIPPKSILDETWDTLTNKIGIPIL
jgi:hypothetical protein